MDTQKRANSEVTSVLYSFIHGSFSFISWRFSWCHEGRKLIESTYSKSNSYLLIDRAYEDSKTLALSEAQGFHAVISPKKNCKSHWLYDKQLYKQRNIIERYFLCLKRFRKVFTRYDKLGFISITSLSFIFDLLFMWTPPNINKKI